MTRGAADSGRPGTAARRVSDAARPGFGSRRRHLAARRASGAVAAWGDEPALFFFSSSGRVEIHSPSSCKRWLTSPVTRSMPHDFDLWPRPPSMPAPCTMVFGFCWMKSGVAAIVLPIVMMDQPMTILAVWLS